MANLIMSYETILILNPNLGEEPASALVTKFKNLITENATLEKVEEWGKRRLAYPIQDEMEGIYFFMKFTCKPDFPAELSRVYKITDGVLRTMIIRNEPEDEKEMPISAAEAPEPDQALAEKTDETDEIEAEEA